MPTPSTEDLQKQLLQLQIARLSREDEERAAAVLSTAAGAAAAAKKEAAEAAEQEAEKRRAALSADLASASTSLRALTGSSVTLPEKSVFRENAASAAALALAARKVAATIRSASGDPTKRVLVTDRTDQVATLQAAAAFSQGLDELHRLAEEALALPLPEDDSGVSKLDEGGGTTPSLDSVAGGVMDLAVSVFDLLSVESTIAASSREATSLETHVAVLHELLHPVGEGVARWAVLHETIGIPLAASDLRTRFEKLRQDASLLAARAGEVDRRIAALGASPKPDELAPLTAVKALAVGAATRIAEFVTRATAPAAGGRSPLEGALAAERLTAAPPRAVSYLAVVTPARIAVDQVALKRRLFAPRVVVSASSTIDVLVLDVATGAITAVASHTSESAFQVRFPMAWWKRDLRPIVDAVAG